MKKESIKTIIKKIIIVILVLISIVMLSFFIPVRTEIKSVILYENPYEDGGKTDNIKVYYNIWDNPIYSIGIAE